MKYGIKAVSDNKAGIDSPELRDVMLNNIISTGYASLLVGLDNNSAAAHGLYYGMTALPEIEEKYKAKNFIDTVVYRGGDALSAWAYAGLTALGLGLSAIALLLMFVMIKRICPVRQFSLVTQEELNQKQFPTGLMK